MIYNPRSAKSIFYVAALGFSAPVWSSPLMDCDDTADKPQISDITININPIFDEPQARTFEWFYDAANRFHIGTQVSVVQQDLLFGIGDTLDINVLKETERHLRARRYFADARIKAEVIECGQVRVNVDVKEVWTFEPHVQFSQTGDQSTFGFGIEESNFLGLGKTIAISKFTDDYRSGTLFGYFDPNTGFYNSTLGVKYADYDDGHVKRLTWTRPFESLRTPWSTGFETVEYERHDRYYNGGEEFDVYQVENERYSVFFGRLLRTSGHDKVLRFKVGYQTQNAAYEGLASTRNLALVPQDQKLQYPWLELHQVEKDFIEIRNLEEMNRVEDVNLGLFALVRLGYAQSEQDDFDDSIPLQLGLLRYFQWSDKQFSRAQMHFSGFYNEQWYDTNLNMTLAHFYKPKAFGGRTQTYVQYHEARLIAPAAGQYLELGTQFGARGYPARYQLGDRRQVLTLEQRFYGIREWFSLFYVGGALFYDVAKAWGEAPFQQADTSVLQSAGFGLRISTNRLSGNENGGHSTLHVDLATPVNPEQPVDRFQFSFAVKKSF